MFQDPTSTTILNGWRTHSDDSVDIPNATLAFLTPADTTGVVNIASSAFTVSVNGKSVGNVVCTPYIVSGGAGTFSVATVTINTDTTPSDTFTFTPSALGTYTLGLTNDRGLENPSPVTYTSVAVLPPLDLSQSWIADIHPKRALNVTQGAIPAGVATVAGRENKISAHTEYAQGTSTSVVTRKLGYDLDNVSATAWTRADNVVGYKPLEIITDPDNGARSTYSQQVSQAGGGWDATHNKKMRSTIGMRGTDNAVALGVPFWVIGAIRVPSYWKSVSIPAKSRDWMVWMDYHLNSGGVITSVGHCTVNWQGGGATPSASQLILSVNRWVNPTYPSGTGTVTRTDYVILADPPADTWIYVALKCSLWHGYRDVSVPQIVDTSHLTVADAYVHPHVAVGNGGMVRTAGHDGYWGVPYVANSANWAYPGYWQQQMYFWPTYTPASAGTDRQMRYLGMQIYRVSDNPDPVNYPTLTAQHILDAFKASRLLTPP